MFILILILSGVFNDTNTLFLVIIILSPLLLNNYLILYLFYIYWWHLGHIFKSFTDDLVVLGLSCGARTLGAARGLSRSVACGPWFPDQG